MNHTEGASPEFRRVAALDKRALERLMAERQGPEIAALPGTEYQGMNIGRLPRLLGIQKFIKGFWRLPDGTVMGYNLRVAQNGPNAPWLAQPTTGTPRRFGFYTVTPVAPDERDSRYLQAMLLDYGQGENGRLNPLSSLRDYLVRVTPGSDVLLLGKAFVAVGRWRWPLGYFLLERRDGISTDSA